MRSCHTGGFSWRYRRTCPGTSLYHVGGLPSIVAVLRSPTLDTERRLRSVRLQLYPDRTAIRYAFGLSRATSFRIVRPCRAADEHGKRNLKSPDRLHSACEHLRSNIAVMSCMVVHGLLNYFSSRCLRTHKEHLGSTVNAPRGNASLLSAFYTPMSDRDDLSLLCQSSIHLSI